MITDLPFLRPVVTGSLVIIGASTGGPQALMEVIPKLPVGLPACVIIVQHMPPNFTRYLAERLDGRSPLNVREAGEGDPIGPGEIYMAPGGMHLFLGERLKRPVVTFLDKNRNQKTACPSIDFALTSYAPVFREKLIGVILTGMGRDGAAGSVTVKKFGGRVICQDRETSMIYGMPGAVAGDGLADRVLPLGEIAGGIVEAVERVGSGVAVNEH